MKLKLIVAMCKSGGIGMKETLPWRLRDDLKRFSKLTQGTGNNAIIMGRKTWDSIPQKFKPLKNRDNLILSKSFTLSQTIDNNLIKTFSSIEDIIETCKKNNYEDVWVIGGANIYNQFINLNMVDEFTHYPH